MHKAHRISVLALATGLLLIAGACSGNNLDDKGSANVVLSIWQFPPIPPVTATTQAGFCMFTVPAATTVTLSNQPKNSLAIESPFNDVVVHSAAVTYTWDDGVVWNSLDTGGLPIYDPAGTGILQSTSGTIPANGTGVVPFTPVLLGYLDITRSGHSANLTIQFYGRTVDGSSVSSLPDSPGGAVVSVNSCPP